MFTTKQKIPLYIAWIQSVIATASSLYLSQVLHWTPCVLCWFQRIFMYPLILIIGVCILREIDDTEYLVWPLTAFGFCISLYHNLLMYRILPESFAPCTASVSCTIPYHFWFGFLTVPLLSFIAFTVITICMYFFHRAKKQALLQK